MGNVGSPTFPELVPESDPWRETVSVDLSGIFGRRRRFSSDELCAAEARADAAAAAAEKAAKEAKEERLLRQKAEREEREARQREAAAKERARQAEKRRVAALHKEEGLRREEVTRLEGVARDAAVAVQEKEAAIADQERRLRKPGHHPVMADPSALRLVLIGPTGVGKSTFGNRLAGDTSPRGDQGPFKCSARTKSETKVESVVPAAVGGQRLALVDTPGLFDSDGEDKYHCNNLVAFLRDNGGGGVNAFVLLVNGTQLRFDANYKRVMEELAGTLGSNFVHHVVVVATKLDCDSLLDDLAEAQDELAEGFGMGQCSPPVVPVGRGSYVGAMDALLAKVPPGRFLCDALRSPLDDLRDELPGLEDARRAADAAVAEARAALHAVQQQLGAALA